jgi:hypothetical protein
LYQTESTSIEDVTLIHHLFVEEILVSNVINATKNVKAIKFFNATTSGILFLV